MPTRLLALKYGADLVYSDEIIDHKVVSRADMGDWTTHDEGQRCWCGGADAAVSARGESGPANGGLCASERSGGVPDVRCRAWACGVADGVCGVWRLRAGGCDGRLVQGTADPQRAGRVAEMVVDDVAAVDVNMGCPKVVERGLRVQGMPSHACERRSFPCMGIWEQRCCHIRNRRRAF
jgi:hypothetical protein